MCSRKPPHEKIQPNNSIEVLYINTNQKFAIAAAFIYFIKFLGELQLITQQNIRYVLCCEVDDGGDEVVSDDDGSDGPPVLCGLSDEKTDALHGHLHHLWRVVQRPYLHQLLLLD